MNHKLKIIMSFIGLLLTTTINSENPPNVTMDGKSKEQAPKFFEIVNDIKTYNRSITAEIYITSWGYEWISNGSKGNLAYNFQGVLDPQGATRILAQGQSTTYSFDKDDPRAEMCIRDVMVKLYGEPNFVPAIQRNNNDKGCPNQYIVITEENGKPVATFAKSRPSRVPARPAWAPEEM